MPKHKKEVALIGLGTRYGAPVRKRFSRISRLQHTRRRCPSCGAWKLKREAVGIWTCRICGLKVAGEAYDVKT